LSADAVFPHNLRRAAFALAIFARFAALALLAMQPPSGNSTVFTGQRALPQTGAGAT
jgi:hypothetical protein